ncbi:MAG: type II toxin-antitoxin system MqsA family antitoxin [Ignavibacteriae bacterium]|nr:type II toxin-antitoxin system MqsA family antitoxin [Ignavibacteriota bacterium]
MSNTFEYCYQCGGVLQLQRVKKIHTWKGELIGVIENVPAWVCNQCGERYYDGEVLEKIDRMMKERTTPTRTFTVPAYVY